MPGWISYIRRFGSSGSSNVRTVAGGLISNDRLLLDWDGRDDAGEPASSGRYVYVAGWRDLRGRGTVTLVK